MLPAELSSGVCSLKAGEERKCVTVEFAFGASAERRDVRFYRSLIRSDHRLTYGFVDDGAGGGRRAARNARRRRLGTR